MAGIRFQNAAANWKNRMGQAGKAYSEGIDAVTSSPMEAAAQNEQGYINGVNEAVATGKWARGLRRVQLSDWKKAAKEKGASRLSTGAAAAEGKVQRFWQTFGPKLEAVTQGVRAMPKSSFEERMARAQAQMTGVHELKGNAY